MNSDKIPVATIGTVTTLATFTLGEWNHLMGLLLGLITILCFIPVGVKRWRGLFYDYKNRSDLSTGLFRWLLTPAKENTSRPPFKSDANEDDI